MQNVLEMLVDKMKEIPERVAIVDHGGNRKTTYGQLDELSSRIAAEIVNRGYKKGTIIPIRMPRCMEYIAAEIGVMKAGCAFTPLIMEYPQDRVHYILEICECDCCIDSAFVQKASENEPLAKNITVKDTDPVYAIFTSGSTGMPKGICHTHKSFSAFMNGHKAVFGINADDLYLDTVTHSFIVSKLYYIVLVRGATVHILSEEERKDIHFLEDYIADKNITFAIISPAQQRVFQNKGKALKKVISAGERLSNRYSKDYQIINYLGSSETHGTFCFYVDKKYENTPIGKPIPGVYAYILDENGCPVPDGMEGELCISGAMLAQGYLKMPEQTAKAFVPNPFSVADDDKILFHTNDVVRKLPDGNYLYLNRKDWLVKINGQRVETGEIEVQTAYVDGVEAAIVKAFDNAYGQKYMVDYYKAGRPVSAETIRAFLKRRMPDYMIPSFFVQVDSFPLNANGKLDRNALTPPNVSDFKTEYAAPKTETEKKLCAAFEEILDCGKVGVNDDFFALGGDSIKVMRLQNICGIPGLSTAVIFEKKTPARIAAAAANTGTDLFAECQAEKRELYPLTPSQMGIYLACIQNPSGTMYNTPAAYTFGKDSGIDIDRLIFAIKAAVNNHAALKITVDDTTGTPFMKPQSAFTFDIPIIKTDNLEQAEKDFVQPFDLKNGPLCRFEILETETLYCLLMDFHHLVFDGTSVSVICREIGLAYDGENIPNEQLTQLDLAVYEEKLESTEMYAAAKAYYDGIFSGVDTKSEIVTDFKENLTVENKPAAEFNIFVSEALSSDKVEAFAHKIGVTPNTLFLGAYEYAVSKFTGQSETIICTVDHGRHDSRMQNTVGMMVRTLPLYAKIDEESTISAFLASVQECLQNTVKNDIYPFVKLSSDYDIVADIMLAYQSDAFNSFEVGGVTLRMKTIPVESSIAKVNIMIFKADGGFELRFEYRSDLYKEATIRSFADMYIKILGEFMVKEKLCAVELLNTRQTAILDSFNNTAVPYDTSKTIIDLFEEQVRNTPDKTALVYLDKHYTYAELDKITDCLAAYIHGNGIGREDVVSVLIPRCEYMVIASLGVLKAGAAYQPLDPSYPPERLNFMIRDAAAKLLIADESLLELVSDYKGTALLTKDIPSLPLCGKPSERPHPDDLFVLLYTSGSTGTPKGAMIEHKNITAFANHHRRHHNITEKSKITAYASYGFDACIMEMYPTLISGAELHIIDEEIRLNLVEINRYLEQNGITHTFMTTQVARQFVTEMDNRSLEYMLTGGEQLVPIEPPKNYILENLYGPTECLVYITSQPVDRLYDRVPIGKANENIKLYVIDKYNRRLPVGALGELCIAGNQVSRGYLNRPEQTAKAYAVNPFTDENGYRKMYHTGDIVRCMPDGRIDFIGRNDGQVKIRGFRIELSEVESVIREYEGITDAVVVARKLSAGGQCINAYITADTKIDIERLNAYIRSKKPPYMVPAATMQLDKIPLNINGKVDKKKLPEIKAAAAPKDKAANARPLTFLEKKISAIVAKIIGHEEFDISDDLLSIGMTSLSVIKLAVELNKAFGFESNVKKMMKGCSVLSIEDELQAFMLTNSGAAKPQPQEEKKHYKAFYPLSETQMGVYLDCMKNPHSTLYNIPSISTFPKTVNAQRLADSVRKVILAHQYILTYLTAQNDNIEQVCVTQTTLDIPVFSMTETELNAFKKDYVQPHSLTKAPLFRIRVVETEANVYLLTDFHHLIFDGASFSLFLNQLKTVYEGGTIEPEKYTYYDYIENEIAAENSTEYKKAERFFDDMMKNFESASEITPDKGGLPENGHLAETAVPIDMTKAEHFCSQNKVTPAHLFLAATFYAVSRFVNSRNVYISTISNGRSDMRVTNCFGMFVRTLPLGMEVEDISALDFVQKSKTLFTDTIENEIYPYTKFCAKYNFAPNIVYEYQMGVVDDLTIGGSAVRRDYLEMNTAKFKTAVHIEKHKGQPCVVVQYNDALYSTDLMQTLAESVACAAERIIENPQGKIRKVSLLTDRQRQQLDNFAAVLTAPVEIQLLHKMFERQAAQTPDRKALVACDRTLTYTELNRLADRTANALIAKGLKKGGRVVILLERTSKFFTTLFGILKAGGAFIPTCPDYPKERIDSIIEDSEADFVVTEGELLTAYDKTLDVNTLLTETNDTPPDVDVAPEDLAYLIYTSGSTGRPKGVMLRHIGIASYLTYSPANIQVKYVVDNCRNYGSVTTVSFDMSLKETLLSLCNGLTLVFANDDQTVNPMALAKLFRENDVDVFNATPSRLLQYMELDSFAEAMANCKVILSGGEKYPERLLKLLREKTNARIINTYGPTEITVSSNAKDLTTADEISVGRPLMNYTEYIVDADDNRLPVGVAGELLIAGCGVALGYNKLPEQTQKAFITFEGKRTYRSGDYAKWTKDGDVVVLGRKDNQVKLRGLRIELGEVEKALTLVEGIKDVIVLIKKVGKADALCAYYTAVQPLDADMIKAELKKSLTDYMVPTAYVWLSEMPLTPNGKINTKALPEPGITEKTQGTLPTTSTEKLFCKIFAQVLGLDTVYADDNFFEIGGSSLTVTRVIIAANKEDLGISYGDVFVNPTPQTLAKLVNKSNASQQNDLENLDNFDYTEIDKLLQKNTLANFMQGDRQPLGDVLLTGAAGFLGIHILHELIHRYSGKIYCLLRDKNGNSAENRLNTMFFYYFEESLKETYADRVVVLNGDVTIKDSFDKFLDYRIDTVINCAANVKHFSKGTDIEDVNLYGTLNVIDFCKKANARFIHVSTMSVGGMFIGTAGSVTHLKETQLYFGQHEGSKYTLSKFLAERAILDEVTKGLNAKIMRVGTLAPRNSDGEYQINFTTNTFMGRLKSNLLIGKYPYDVIEMPFELSPIDFVAKAILLLAQTPKECTVFHPFNNHTLMMGDLYAEMDKMGLCSSAVERDEYEKALEEAKQNPEKAKILSSMIAYQNMAHGQKTYTVSKSNAYTMQVLYRMGFRWPVTSLDYMKRFINALKGLGFFD